MFAIKERMIFMREYKVKIKEILAMTVSVEAESAA
ncbi:MAG: hypothetical protein LBD58_05555 [Treponema sp.]|jgi:hypothetical protein|nr:hypothetical protein [Treponema sp.]